MVAEYNRKVGGHAKEVMQLNSNDNEIGRLTGPEQPQGSVGAFTNLIICQTTDEEKLNKLERAWLRQLRVLFPADHIGIQSITLKLANDTRYTADFWTIDANGQLIFWETKGFMRDDANVKIKVAARQFRWARFILVEKKKGEWIETPIKP